MKNIKKTLSFVLLLIFACSVLLFGCGDKYKDLKVTTDAPENGINLYIGKDTENQILSVASFTATVSGAGEDVSTRLKYRFSSQNRVSVSTEYMGEQTKFTLTAVDYGSTTLTIFTEEGNKSTTVQITVVKEVEALNLFTSYKPFVFAGQTSTIDTAKAINYQPADTSQKEVTYSMVGSYAGVTVEPNGKIVTTAEAASGTFEVVAKSVDNPSISSAPIKVRVFKAITLDDIQINYSDGKDSLVLSTSVIPAEVTKMITFNIDTQEDYFVDDPVCTSASGEIVVFEKLDNNNFKVTGINPGRGTIKFNLALVDGETIYQNTKLEILVPVEVKQYATSIKLNGSDEAINDIYLYDTYQNQHGEKFLVQVGEENAQDKRYVISLSDEDAEKLTIVDSSNREIIPYNKNGNGSYDILDNNSTVFIRIKEGYNLESTATINFLAYGTLDLICEPTSNIITAQLKHGVEELTINPLMLTQHTDGMYLLGIDTNTDDDSRIISVEIPKDQFTSYVQTKVTGDFVEIADKIDFSDALVSINKTTFDFVVKGKAEGISSIEFIAENGVSKALNFRVYNKINAFQVTSQTINQNSSIGEVKYQNQVTTFNGTPVQRNSLSKIAIALNGEVKLGIIPIYYDGNNAYNVDTKYLIKCEVTGSDCVSFLSNNSLVAKKLTDEVQTITVSMTVFCESGELQLANQTIEVEVFYEIKQVFLDSTYQKLYTYDDLALADKDMASHTFELKYNDGTKDIAITDGILWQVGGQDQASIVLNGSTVTATNLSGGRNTGLATLTAIYVKYGRTYIVQANIEIVKAERITDIYNLSYTKDGKTSLITKQYVLIEETIDNYGEVHQQYSEEYYIYLDARSGISKGTTFSIGQTIEPSTAYNKTLIYTVQNAVENEAVPVLIIDEKGNVTINRTGGTAYITIAAKDSEQQDGTYLISKQIFVKIADGNSSVTALEISNEYDLLAINNNTESLTKFYQITKDINLSNLTSNSEWTPIGIIDGTIHEFSGNINGKIITQGETYICTISGFNINFSSDENVATLGLFATLSQNAVINNLNILFNKININHTAADNLSLFTFGGLAAINNGQIKNVNVSFADTNSQIAECAYTSNIGGLVGINNGNVYQCYADGYINHIKQNSLNTSTTNIGGLVGINNSQIDGNSKLVNDKDFADDYTSLINIDSAYYNANNIKTYSEISGDINVGGVVGYNNNVVTNCSFEGRLKAINNVGSIVGCNAGQVSNCFASGYVNGFTNVGGIAGSSVGTIDFCGVNMFDDFDVAYEGEITPNIIGRNDNIGGLVGSLNGTSLTNSYVKTYYVRTTSNYFGDIYILSGARAQNIGGLVGFAKDASISKSFSQVNINTTELNAYVGGLVGGAENVTVTNCYTMGSIKLKDTTNSYAGKMFGLLNSNSYLSTSYSTITDANININYSSANAFVAVVANGSLTVANSYNLSSGSDSYAKTNDELTDIGTYSSWSIANNLTSGTDWYINGDNNNGYPMLVVDSSKLSIEAPNSINIVLNESNDNMKKLSDTSAIVWRGSESLSVYLVNATKGLFSSITVNPQDAGMAYNVTSSDESILRISGRNKDRIVPIANGEVTLTITSRLNNTVSESITIYVVNKIESFNIDKTEISSLVNQIQTTTISAKNMLDYRLEILVYGGNNQYININNKSIDQNGIIDIDFTNRLYIYSTKSITDSDFKIYVTPYIVVAGQKIYLEQYQKQIEYSSYYGIKNYNCNLLNINITENDSARLVYTATGDDLRVGDALPQISFYGNITINNVNVLTFELASIVAYDYAGNITIDYANNAISKIVYEYIVKVDKQAFNSAIETANSQQLKFDITASISLSGDTDLEGTFADAVTKFTITKQQLKNIGVEFFTESQKIKNADGEIEYTVNEASSHQIITGKTGLLKVSLYPQTSEVVEVRVYNASSGANNISMAQLLKSPVYNQDDQIVSYRYVERKPYAITLVDKNGLVLWNESNIDGNSTTFDGTFYVGFIIPSSVPISTEYTIYVEADLKDGRTLVQTYKLYSDIPSEVSISYNFEGLQTVTDTAYVAYGVEHTITVEVAKLAVEETSKGDGIKDLTISSSSDGVYFEYDKENSVLNSGSFSYIRYKFNITDKTITSFDVNVTMQKVVNSQLTTFKSNTIKFNLRDFVVKSIDIVTDSTMSDTLALATNNSKQLKVVIDAQYADYSALENATDEQKQYTLDVKANINSLQDLIAKDLTSWQAKKSLTDNTFECLETTTYPNFKISQTTTNDYIVIQPIKASSGDEIYVAINLDYSTDNDNNGLVDITSTSPKVNAITGFDGSEQTLISKVTTNFFRDISAKNSIPVGNLQDENQTDLTAQQNTQAGEISFEEIQNGTSEGRLYYRLKENITLTNYTPLDLSYVEIDGNGYTITIKSFSQEAIDAGNLGLINTTDQNTLLSNIKLEYKLTNDNFDYTEVEDITSVNFGGLVVTNNGIIYNCQIVGGSIGVKTVTNSTSGAEVYVGGLVATNSGTISFSSSSLNLSINRGYVGGLIAQNSGKISNSKVVFSGTGITNTSTTELSTLAGGFVARNTGKIYGSYISGTTLENGRYKDIISSYTPIGAFVNTNLGEIHNSYANITVVCQTRSSGFVYNNSGTISSCYTASKMAQNSAAHNPFVGVNESGVNNTGTIADCYYLTDLFGSTSQEPAIKLTTEQFAKKSSFAQFVFADKDTKALNGTWYMGTYGPTLVDADLNIVSEQTYNGLVEENGKLTYSWTYKDSNLESGKNDNGKYNFRTITDFSQFNSVINGTTTNDYFVLLCDITCDDYVTPQTAELSFTGTLLGNNMLIENLYLKASNTNTNSYFGLFGELADSTVKDLSIKAKQATANNTSYVGILAGRITDSSNITNISIDGSSVYVQGKYFVGGIAGYVQNSYIAKVSVATTVNASYRGTETHATVFDKISDDGNYNFTYSGVAVGVLTGLSTLKDVTVTGNSIAIGYYASACVGLVDSGSTLSLANVQIDPSQYVRAYYVAGGVVAENRGTVERCSIAHADNVQSVIDTNNSNANRNLTFFAGSPQIIGGLVGFNNGGRISDSYSKLDVRAETLATKVAGGLVGTIISGTIQNSYATGSVVGRRVIGGLIGSITSKDSICYKDASDAQLLNSSAVFEEQDKIADAEVEIYNVFASNRWLTGAGYNDLNSIAAAFQKGLLIGCFNRIDTEDINSDDIATSNCFVNTQVTQNTISSGSSSKDINKIAQSNAVLIAFNGDNEIAPTDMTVVEYIQQVLSCGKYTINFDGTASDATTAAPTVDVKVQNNASDVSNPQTGTYITFYFLNNFDSNMSTIITNKDIISEGKLNAPESGVSIYPTIIRNINL